MVSGDQPKKGKKGRDMLICLVVNTFFVLFWEASVGLVVYALGIQLPSKKVFIPLKPTKTTFPIGYILYIVFLIFSFYNQTCKYLCDTFGSFVGFLRFQHVAFSKVPLTEESTAMKHHKASNVKTNHIWTPKLLDSLWPLRSVEDFNFKTSVTWCKNHGTPQTPLC